MSNDNPWKMYSKCGNDPIVQAEMLYDGYDRFIDTKDNNEVVKRYCSDCPVINECLDYAMTMLKRSKAESDRSLYPYGIWGGTSQNDRSVMLKRQTRTEAKILKLVEQMKAPVRGNDNPIAS